MRRSRALPRVTRAQFWYAVVALWLAFIPLAPAYADNTNPLGFPSAGGGGAGGGSVTSVDANDITGLATKSVSNPTTTPVITFNLNSQTQNKAFMSPNGSSGAPTFRAIVLSDLPLISIAAGGTGATTQQGAVNAVLGFPSVAKGDLAVFNGTNWVRFGVGADGTVIVADSAQTVGIKWASAGTGTVTSVGLSLTNIPFLSIAGSPVTTSGTFALSAACTLGDIIYASATNTLAKLAGNTTTAKQFLTQTGNGTVSAAPTWAGLVSGDLPPINLASTGNGGVTGTLPLGNGGSGATTSQGFIDAAHAFASVAKGDIAVYDGTHWQRLPVGANTFVLTADSAQTLGVKWAAGGGGGGMTNPMTTAEDIIKGGASGTPARLAVGKIDQRLGVDTSSAVNYLDSNLRPGFSVPVLRNIAQMRSDEDSGALSTIGAQATTTTGTQSTSNDSDTFWFKCTSGAVSGNAASTSWCTGYWKMHPALFTKCKEVTTTNVRYWFSLASSSVGTAQGNNDPSGNSNIGIRRVPGTDTNYKCYCSNGTSSTITDSGVAGDTNQHTFDWYYVSSSSVLFFIDGNNVANITTNVPSTAGFTVVPFSATTLTTSGAEIRFRSCWYERD